MRFSLCLYQRYWPNQEKVGKARHFEREYIYIVSLEVPLADAGQMACRKPKGRGWLLDWCLTVWRWRLFFFLNTWPRCSLPMLSDGSSLTHTWAPLTTCFKWCLVLFNAIGSWCKRARALETSNPTAMKHFFWFLQSHTGLFLWQPGGKRNLFQIRIMKA